MENLAFDMSKLFTKINNICHIMVYYGYVSEGAELFRQLCRASRNTWDDNFKAINKVIMNNKKL